MASRKHGVVAAVLAAWIASAYGQGMPADRRLLEDTRQRQRETAPAPVSGQDKSAAQTPSLSEDPASVNEPGASFVAAELRIDDPAALLPAEEKSALLSRYEALALGRNRLSLLVRQLNAKLVVHGLVTSHAVLSTVDTANKRIVITLVAGRVEALQQRGENLPSDLRRAFAAQEGEVLQVMDVEQAVRQINRLRLYRAEVDILPGQQPGTSIVDLNVTRASPWHGFIGSDNLGQRSTGVARARAGVSLDNLLGQLDNLALSYVRARQNQAALASLAVPSGYSTYSVTASASNYHQHIDSSLTQRGNSQGLLLGWNRMLTLEAGGSSWVDATLSRSASRRRFEDIDLAAERLSVLRMAYSRRVESPMLPWYAEVGLSKGLPWLGANRDAGESARSDAHAQFWKLDAHLGTVTHLGATSFDYAPQLDAQYSGVALYGSETFQASGMASVRGFEEGVLAGDSGYVLRHEVRPAQPLPIAQTPLRLTPYLFVDHGEVHHADGPTQRLAGAGLGLRANAGGLALQAVAAKPIRCSDSAVPRHWRAQVSIVYEF